MLRCNISPVSLYPQATQERLAKGAALRISTIYGFDVSTERSSRIMPLRPPASSSPTASGQGCRPNPTLKANSGPQKVRPGSRLAAHGPLSRAYHPNYRRAALQRISPRQSAMP